MKTVDDVIMFFFKGWTLAPSGRWALPVTHSSKPCFPGSLCETDNSDNSDMNGRPIRRPQRKFTERKGHQKNMSSKNVPNKKVPKYIPKNIRSEKVTKTVEQKRTEYKGSQISFDLKHTKIH